MQDSATRPAGLFARASALLNRPPGPAYRARSAYDFVILLFLAGVLTTVTLALSNHEQKLLLGAIGCVVGLLVYFLSRLTLGRRLFFQQSRSLTQRIIRSALILLIPVTAVLYPAFREVLIDSVWFLVAVSIFALAQALEGLSRQEWLNKLEE